MLYNAKNKTVQVDGVAMRYVEFGYGKKPLVLLPGLSDGLKTVRGQALKLSWYYKEFAKEYRVFLFSRKDILPPKYTTKDMAHDLKKALDNIGIDKIYLLGVSQGGMIAQNFAIHYPSVVEKLVLVVSSSKINEVLRNTISNWVLLAENNDYKSMMIDMLEKTYSPKMLEKYRPAYPIISRIGKPKDFRRFFIQADACLTHNTYSELEKICCPTLIIGGDSDNVVGSAAAQEMAHKITNSTLLVYEGLGHATFEEADDFTENVLTFLQGKDFPPSRFVSL